MSSLDCNVSSGLYHFYFAYLLFFMQHSAVVGCLWVFIPHSNALGLKQHSLLIISAFSAALETFTPTIARWNKQGAVYVWAIWHRVQVKKMKYKRASSGWRFKMQRLWFMSLYSSELWLYSSWKLITEVIIFFSMHCAQEIGTMPQDPRNEVCHCLCVPARIGLESTMRFV